jgi:hypothetical protein
MKGFFKVFLLSAMQHIHLDAGNFHIRTTSQPPAKGLNPVNMRFQI